MNYHEIEARVNMFLPNSEVALRIVLAIAASSVGTNHLMLWLLLVGPPSSGKTDLVRLIKDAKAVYYLDNLTQNAFISGEREKDKEKVHDLLPQLDKKCLIIKDWTAIFSLDEKMTKKLLGELVGIYDKEFSKFSSRRGLIQYNSTFAQIGCITPATLNKHAQYLNMVGPRFLCYSLPLVSIEQEEVSFEAIFSNQDRSNLEIETRKIVSEYLDQLTQQDIIFPPISKEIGQYLKTASRLVANCRGTVNTQASTFTDGEGKVVKYYEILDFQIEAPFRASHQLMLLAQYLAYVAGKKEIEAEELEMIKEIVISSMPADRSQALRALKDSDGELIAKELSESSDKSVRTSQRLLTELTALKVVEKIYEGGTTPNVYKLSDQFSDFLLLSSAEFLSSNASRTENPFSNKTITEQLSPKEEIRQLVTKLDRAFRWKQKHNPSQDKLAKIDEQAEVFIKRLEELGIPRITSEVVYVMGCGDIDDLLNQISQNDQTTEV